MKKVFLMVGFLLAVALSFGQDSISNINMDSPKTLFKGKTGWNVGLTASVTSIDNYCSVMPGGSFSVNFDHRFAVGVTCFSFGDNSDARRFNDEGYYLEGEYGGLFLEFSAMHKKPVHFTFPVVMGTGKVEVISTKHLEGHNYDRQKVDEGDFLFIEPGVMVEINICKFMRIAAGGSFRHTFGLEVNNFNTNVLNQPNGLITLKFGRF
jgi:hypothetical protein